MIKELKWKSNKGSHDPNFINGAKAEQVAGFKFLGVHIADDPTESIITSILIKEAQQHLHFLRRLIRAHLSQKHLANFYHCAVKSKITFCVTVWYRNCTVGEQKAQQWVVKLLSAPLAPSYLPLKTFTKNPVSSVGVTHDPTHPCSGLLVPLWETVPVSVGSNYKAQEEFFS